ncbi:MAG: TRAM domain-containing protein, partial [Thermodesulfobacteriota bacterium]
SETEDDFLKTYDYMQKVKYDSAFMFIYSPREGAKAFSWGDPIPYQEKVKRLESLIKLQEKISLEINQREVGKESLVLVEGQAKKEKGYLFGKNPQFKTVVFPQDGIKAGDFVTVSIKEATPHTLLGVVQ